MPAYFQSRAVYRGLRSSSGLATMRDLWSAASWVGGQLGQDVVIDGVEQAKPTGLRAEVPQALDARTAATFKAPDAQLRFTRSRGLAQRGDLHRFAAWLQPHLALRWRSDDARLSMRRPSGRLPLPGKQGLLLRAELAAFLVAAGARLGFAVESADISGIRDTGSGFHVSRKKQRVASLILRVQLRSGHSKVCGLGVDEEEGWISKRVETYTFENGSYTVTITPTGEIQGIAPGESFDLCGDGTTVSTYDPEFDYGAMTDQEAVDTFEPLSDLITAARGAIDDGDLVDNLWTPGWFESEWPAASEPRNQAIPYNSSSTLGGVYGEEEGEGWNYHRPRIQIENTGPVPLEIEITFTRPSDSEEDVLDPITIAPGDESDWIDYPDPSEGETWAAAITRVGIAGY